MQAKFNPLDWGGTTWLCIGCACVTIVGGIASIPGAHKAEDNQDTNVILSAIARDVWNTAVKESQSPKSPCYGDPWCVVNHWETETAEGITRGQLRLQAINQLRHQRESKL
ncbi:MAG: hypothetical protein B0A82_07615 [Alkalinema sp. CACIAM 70d]|nr:MAG: hypothetical protein B0A82_07615 [Alkalinema sp. CACIAM 70d]